MRISRTAWIARSLHHLPSTSSMLTSSSCDEWDAVFEAVNGGPVNERALFCT